MKHEILKDKTLALFFSCGVSLKTWHDIGMIEREVAIYNELSKYFKHIYFFTYGDAGDLQYRTYLANNITIIPKKYFINSMLYSVVLPFIHYKTLKKINILKTNQMFGAWSAALAKLICHNKLVVRTGYMWSVNFSKERPKSRQLPLIKKTERFVYQRADAAITSSEEIYKYVAENYHPRNHAFIPNYVEADVFKPLHLVKKKGSICFVGSLYYAKNPLALLEALKGLSYEIDFVGSGPLLSQMQEIAKREGIKANFLGNQPNHKLPEILNQHELFILPSLWEGMPKTLLEAMSCGLPVIGTRVSGIKEVIKDGENGILCDTDANSIRQAIIRLMEDEGLRGQLGKNARETIEQQFSLAKLSERELELYAKLLS